MTNTPRIFLVTNTRDKTKRLVRAASRISAQKHVATGCYETRLATQDDLAELLTRGASVETAAPGTNPQSAVL